MHIELKMKNKKKNHFLKLLYYINSYSFFSWVNFFIISLKLYLSKMKKPHQLIFSVYSKGNLKC